LVAEYFIILFVLLFVNCLETYASLPDTLLRHASHLTIPIFIISVEHLALKKIQNPNFDQNYEALGLDPAVNNEEFMLPFNAQRLAVCEKIIKLNNTGNICTKGH
jgi:hypothetical protein